MKKEKIIYWSATGLLSAFMLFTSIVFYIVNYDMMVQNFDALGFPAFLIYPMAIAKILGVLAIVFKPSKILKDLAYAGFLLDFVFATGAHLNAGDGQFFMPLFALLLLVISFIYDRKIYS